MKAIAAVFILMMSWQPSCDMSPTGPTSPTDYSSSTSQPNPGPRTTTIIRHRHYEVAGYVRDDVSHIAVPAARVYLNGSLRVTRIDGVYRFSVSPIGEMRIVTTHPQYKPDTTYINVIPESASVVQYDIYLSLSGS